MRLPHKSPSPARNFRKDRANAITLVTGASLPSVHRDQGLTSLCPAARNRSVTMPIDVLRRDFLKGAAAIAGATGGFSCVGISSPPHLKFRPSTSSQSACSSTAASTCSFRPTTVKGVAVAAPPRTDFRRSLHNEWGLSLFLESQRGDEQRNLMLDFGYSPDLAPEQHGDMRRRRTQAQRADR